MGRAERRREARQATKPVSVADLVILMPTKGEVESETLVGLIQLQSVMTYRLRQAVRVSLLPQARSGLLTLFLSEMAESFCMFIDSDMSFSAADVQRVLADLRAGHDLVSGLYVRSDGQEFALDTRVPLPVDGGLHEVRAVGMGFMGISRRLLERMVTELPLYPATLGGKQILPFSESCVRLDVGGWEFDGEDYNFCHKARRLGVPVMVDTSVRLGHVCRTTRTVDDVMSRQRSA